VVLVVACAALAYEAYSATTALRNLEAQVVGKPPQIARLLSASEVNSAIGQNFSLQVTLNISGANHYGSLATAAYMDTQQPALFIMITVFGYPSPIYANVDYNNGFLYVANHTQHVDAGSIDGWSYTAYYNGTQSSVNYMFLGAVHGSYLATIIIQVFGPQVQVGVSQAVAILGAEAQIAPSS
jgi:hypothetical protein